jgi:hypothetical protein
LALYFSAPLAFYGSIYPATCNHPRGAVRTGTFVVPLTRSDENLGHQKVFLQIDKMLDEIGEQF